MSDFVSKPELVTAGVWAGWRAWQREPFEELAGPFYCREQTEGIRCAFRIEPRHLNGIGTAHGGCLASFADSAIFSLSESSWIDSGGVTIGLNLQYVGAARLGDLVEAHALSVHATKQFVFVSGIAHVNDAPVLAFTGTIKILGPKPA